MTAEERHTGEFVNRDEELRRLGDELDRARSGDPRVLVVEGPAGIGKSALVRRLLAGRDVQLVQASGDECEQALAGGLADQLLAHPRARAVGADDAGRLRSRAALDLGSRLVELLGALGEAGPVVVFVDDAQWADSVSLEALTFALRRLVADPVLAVLACRETLGLPEGLLRLFATDRGSRICLGGLAVEDLGRLAAALGRHLAPSSLDRLRAHTGGNPLYFRALLEEVSPERLAVTEFPLPAPRAFSHAVMAKLARCRQDTRRLVAAAAVLGVRSNVDLVARVAESPGPLPALEQAVSAGLLEFPAAPLGAEVSFEHLLVRAAVYHGLGPGERARLHGLAALAVADEVEALRHRMLASAGPDAELSGELSSLGERETARANWSTAGWAFANAARLHPDRHVSERLVLSAVEVLLLAGDQAQLEPLVAGLHRLEETARRLYVEGCVASVRGRLSAAEELLRASWARCNRSQDATLAASIADQVGLVLLQRGRGEEAAAWCRTALSSLEPGESPPVYARLGLALGLGTAGRGDQALGALADVPEAVSVAELPDFASLVGRGVVRLWSDDLDRARRDLTRVLAAGERVPVVLRTLALGARAQVNARAGRWDDAIVDLERLTTTADAARLSGFALVAHWIKPYPLAARGQWAAAEEHVRVAELGANAESPASVTAAAAARAYVAYCRHDFEAVVKAVQPVLDLPAELAYELGAVRWRDICVESLANLGRFEEAETILADLHALAAARGQKSAMANAARARGHLAAARGDRHGAEAAFLAAVELSEAVPVPFDAALAHLSFGAYLRRAGRRRDGAGHLERALAAFCDLGAIVFVERCERELAACGLTPAKRRGRDPLQLTPRELAVARLAATGQTNQQIASILVVSVKTVEFHLGNVFAKLGVTARTELVGHLGDG